MFTVVVEFRIHPPYAEAFRDAIVENARLSVELEAGCQQFDVCCDPADPALFFLYEIYDSADAFQVHLKSAHFLQMNERTATWVASKQVKTFQRVQP